MKKDSCSEGPSAAVSNIRPWFRANVVVRSTCIAALLLVGFLAGVGVTSVRLDGEGAGAASSFVDTPEFQVLQETWDLAHDEYVESSTINDADLIYGAAAGMVGALGDENHSRFLAPQEAESYKQSLRGELTGIGVYLSYLEDEPVITRPMEGGPAITAGIQANDVIVGIDGEPTRGLDGVKIGEALRGEAGTQVTVEILRPETDETLSFTLTRAEIKIDPVTWSMLPQQVAHIRLSQFTGGSLDEMKLAIQEARAAGATAIILDLRDNPGGLVDQAIGIASEFLPLDEVIYKERNRDGVVSVKRTLPGQSAVDLPLVVLINEYSASAAEILAGAIRDNDRGTLIGETTLGTGTVLTQYNISNGATLLLGTDLWLTAGGDQIWKVGVEPDEVVTLPDDVTPTAPELDPEVTEAELEESEDTQLQAAFEAVTAVASAAP